MKVDWVVIGAGLSGATFARAAYERGKEVLVVEKRKHLAGNAFEEDGVHKYGPHLFHTNSEKVFCFLSRFTEWKRYIHRVLGEVDGQLVSIPPNLDTIEQLCGVVPEFRDEEVSIRKVPEEIRECLWRKIYRPYSEKQWGMDPELLKDSVLGRVKVRFNYDTRYFTDRWQVLPAKGYTAMVESMLHGIPVVLGERFYPEIAPGARIYWTGAIDDYFDNYLGPLPYRGNRIELREGPRQPAATVNYPQDGDWTRSTDYRYITGREVIAWEYPSEGFRNPMYPVHTDDSRELLRRYQALNESTDRVVFAGRLGSFMYYNMDQAVAQALSLAEKVL